MPYKLDYKYRAKQDLKSIFKYLGLFYPSTPLKFKQDFNTTKRFLRDNPYIYPIYLSNPIYRKAVVQKYIVFYTINEDEKLVEIYRILPGNMDIENII
jgi:plasmid stabilization system protein ParE